MLCSPEWSPAIHIHIHINLHLQLALSLCDAPQPRYRNIRVNTAQQTTFSADLRSAREKTSHHSNTLPSRGGVVHYLYLYLYCGCNGGTALAPSGTPRSRHLQEVVSTQPRSTQHADWAGVGRGGWIGQGLGRVCVLRVLDPLARLGFVSCEHELDCSWMYLLCVYGAIARDRNSSYSYSVHLRTRFTNAIASHGSTISDSTRSCYGDSER